MNNLNSEGNTPGEPTKRKPRLIKRFEKPPPLKVSDKAQFSKATSSTFKENMNVSTPAAEVTDSEHENEVLLLKNIIFPNEYKNLLSTHEKFKQSSNSKGKTIYGDTTPENDRLYCLMHNLRMLQVTCTSDKELNSQNNLSSKNKRKFPTNSASNQAANGSQDKNQMWSLSSTIWSPEVQVKSKEISCSLSLKGTLILTNMYSGSLCSTKEYSKPTLLKPLNLVKDDKIWSADQLSFENRRSQASDKFLQSNSNGTLPDKNELSSEKENNLFKASQAQQPTASIQQKAESQFTQQPASQYEDNSTSVPVKKSKMTMLLERLRSEAQSEQPPPDTTSSPPKPLPSKTYCRTSSSPSSPCKNKSPSSTVSPASRAASVGSHSPGVRSWGSCYNCGLDDHKHFNCPRPLTRSFCYRCGWEDVSSDACPFCTGTLVRPGSKRPVPVGGDARRKFDSVDLERTHEEYKMKAEKKSKKYQ